MSKYFLAFFLINLSGFAQNRKMLFQTTYGNEKTYSCPDSLTLNKMYFNGVNAPSTIPCDSNNINYMVNVPLNSDTLGVYSFAPCIKIEFSPSSFTNFSTNGTFTINEGAYFYDCLGPVGSGCTNVPDYLGAFYYYQMDYTQPHSFEFCRNGAITTTTVSINNCWSNTPYTTPVVWSNSGPNCFTITIPPSVNIGVGYFPSDVPGAINDWHKGIADFSVAVAGIGKHWMKYNWNDGVGCAESVTDTFFVTGPCTPQAISSQERMELINVFPNPVNNILQIQALIKIESIIVRDILGNQVKPEIKNTSVDVSNLQNGVYFITLTSGKENFTQKFIVNH